MSNCKRCREPTSNESTRWCDDCFYPGIDDDYEEYQSLLEEGHRPIQAAVMSGWQDPGEAGAYYEDNQ